MSYAPRSPRMRWTPKQEAVLKFLWEATLEDEMGSYPMYSASKIADMMGSVTRSAVIGKARRMGLSKRS